MGSTLSCPVPRDAGRNSGDDSALSLKIALSGVPAYDNAQTDLIAGKPTTGISPGLAGPVHDQADPEPSRTLDAEALHQAFWRSVMSVVAHDIQISDDSRLYTADGNRTGSLLVAHGVNRSGQRVLKSLQFWVARTERQGDHAALDH